MTQPKPSENGGEGEEPSRTALGSDWQKVSGESYAGSKKSFYECKMAAAWQLGICYKDDSSSKADCILRCYNTNPNQPPAIDEGGLAAEDTAIREACGIEGQDIVCVDPENPDDPLASGPSDVAHGRVFEPGGGPDFRVECTDDPCEVEEAEEGPGEPTVAK